MSYLSKPQKKRSSFIKALFLFFMASSLIFCQGRVFQAKAGELSSEDLYRSAREAFYALTESGDASKDRKAWSAVAALFQKVHERFPKSHRSDEAAYTGARIYYDLFKKYGDEKDLGQALDLFRKVTMDYPASRLADDAQFKIGEIYLQVKKDPKEALSAYEKIPKLYPEGDKIPEANKIIASLRKTLPPEPEKKKPVQVFGIRHWSNPTYTRIVIDLASSLEFKELQLRDPDRLYIDLYDAEISENLQSNPIDVNDGLLKQVRASQYKPDVVRVVFDVKNFHDFKVFSYENPFRVVMDIRGKPVEKKKEIAAPLPPSEKPSTNEVEPSPPIHGIKRIVIDPGHGGKDNGATGLMDIKEKDVVLDIALRLQKILLARGAGEVILTRDNDIYIPLEERTAIANTSNGDIFISIHGNSAPRKAAYGIETFFLSNALSERALETALRENMAPAKDMSDDLRFILSDMLANSNMKESSELAATIQKNLVGGLQKSYPTIKDLGAKGGPFYVLHGANMPSVLVEVAFLSNPMEAKRIKLPGYREKIALSLYEGIERYIQEVKFAFKSKE